MPTEAEVKQKVLELHKAGKTQEAQRLAQAFRNTKGPPVEKSKSTSVIDTMKHVYNPKNWQLPKREPGAMTTFDDAKALGLGNEIQAAGQTLADTITGVDSDKSLKEKYSSILAEMVAEKKKFAENTPGKAMGVSLLGGAITGGAVTKSGSPMPWKTAVGLGSAEGAGLSEENRTAGAIAGAIGGTLGPLAQGAIQKFPKAAKGLSNLFGGAKEPDSVTSRKIAENFIANNARRLGKTEADIGGTMSAHDTVGDVLSRGFKPGEGFDPMIQASVASSDDAANLARRGVMGNKSLTGQSRLQERLGMNKAARDANIGFETSLESSRKAIGKQLNARRSELAGEPIEGQDKILSFLDQGSNKKYLKKALDNLESRGEKITYAGDLGVDVEDVNEIVVDRVLAKEVKDVMSKELKELAAKQSSGITTTATPKDAHLTKLMDDFDNLTSESGDEVLSKLNAQYRKVKQQQSNYLDGAEKFKSMSQDKLTKKLRKLSGEELEAFRKGAITNLSDDPKALYSMLGDADGKGLQKIEAIFGEPAARSGKTIAESEAGYAARENAIMKGLREQAEGVSQNTKEGKLSAVKNLFGRLEGKRAYSAQGGIFLFANEVVDIIQRGDLPESVFKEMFKILEKTGPDANHFLTELSRKHMPNVVKAELATLANKNLNRALGVGYGAGASALTQEMRGEY